MWLIDENLHGNNSTCVLAFQLSVKQCAMVVCLVASRATNTLVQADDNVE